MPRPGKDRFARAPLCVGLLCACLASGCLVNRAQVEKNLMTDRDSPARKQGVLEKYRVACPDVLGLRIEGRYALAGKYAIGPDGRLDLGAMGKPRVEGHTLPELAHIISHHLGTHPALVQVQVAEFKSQQLLLFGEVVGWQRAVPYQGQETVLDVLQRVGGITSGAAPNQIYLVRSHLADGHRAEVISIDLQAIVLNRDHETNVRVMPYDQIYVGATRQAQIERFIPPWVKPVYQAIWNMVPNGKEPQEKLNGVSAWIRGWFAVREPAVFKEGAE